MAIVNLEQGSVNAVSNFSFGSMAALIQSAI
jgi:hypothetical protein